MWMVFNRNFPMMTKLGETTMLNLNADSREDSLRLRVSCSVDDGVEIKVLLVDDEEDESNFQVLFSVYLDGLWQEEVQA
jgi:hypothetical protein